MTVTSVRRVGICPCPPVLLPGATGASCVPDVESLRDGCRDLVRWLGEDGEPVLVLAAGGPRDVPEGTRLSARAFGLGFQTVLGATTRSAAPVVPTVPGVIVAAYLLGGHPARAVMVGDHEAALAEVIEAEPRSLLVMGGGSARRRDGAPGHLDPRAVPFDDDLVARIGSPDLPALADPDLELAHELLADLPGPLAIAARLLTGMKPRATVDSYAAPYGVAYIVARWSTDD